MDVGSVTRAEGVAISVGTLPPPTRWIFACASRRFSGSVNVSAIWRGVASNRVPGGGEDATNAA